VICVLGAVVTALLEGTFRLFLFSGFTFG
jgi:hypothetical protein